MYCMCIQNVLLVPVKDSLPIHWVGMGGRREVMAWKAQITQEKKYRDGQQNENKNEDKHIKKH